MGLSPLLACAPTIDVEPDEIDFAFARRHADGGVALLGAEIGRGEIELAPASHECVTTARAWSFDGSRLAMTRRCAGITDLLVMTLADGHTETIEDADAPRWSHVDDVLAHRQGDALVLFAVATGERRRIEGAGAASWSTRDDAIAFAWRGDDAVDDAIVVQDGLDGAQRRLDLVDAESCGWSPAGDRLAVIGRWPSASDPLALHLVDASTLAVQTLGEPAQCPSWSPSGEALLFDLDAQTYGLADLSASQPWAVERAPLDQRELLGWSPDGELAFAAWLHGAGGPDDRYVELLAPAQGRRSSIPRARDVAWSAVGDEAVTTWPPDARGLDGPQLFELREHPWQTRGPEVNASDDGVLWRPHR